MEFQTAKRLAKESDPDDGLVLRWFATRPAHSVGGAMRHADALARAGRDREATEVARRGWSEAPGDGPDESLFLERHAARLAHAERLAHAPRRRRGLAESSPGRRDAV